MAGVKAAWMVVIWVCKHMTMLNRFLFFSLFVFGSLGAFAQCCSSSSHCEFQKLADNSGFTAVHDEPQPFSYEGKGEIIRFEVPEDKQAQAFEIRKEASKKWIILLHEWWGLNDYIKNEAARYAERFSVNVLALDLYDGKLALTREEAAQYMKAADEKRIRKIIDAALNYTKSNEIVSVGWCFGGAWSLQTALLAGDRAKACVIYYGMPEKNEEQLSKLQAPVLGIWASEDAWINKEVVDAFSERMKKLDKSLVNHTYKADHAFANPSNPKFNQEASEQAFKRVEAFINAQVNPNKLPVPEPLKVFPPSY